MHPGNSITGLKRNILLILLLIMGPVSLFAQINIQAHYMKGRQQLASHEFTQAIQSFNTILQYIPDHAEAFFYRGLAKFHLSDYSGAESDFTRSIEIKPYKTEALYYRALAKVERSRYMDAFRDVQQAIELDNRHPEYFITRGWMHLEYGDTAGAIQDYKKAIELDPFLDNAHLNLATIYTRQGKYKEALSHCDSAAGINRFNPGLPLTRGNVYQLQERFPEAIEQYNLVLEDDSLNARAWFYIAHCHRALNHYDTALNAFNRTIELNRNNALGYYHRGLLQLENEYYRKALDDFNRVVSLSPKNIYGYYIRGIIKTRLEDYAGAEKDFSVAIDLYPNLIHAYRDRSVIRMAQNDMKGYTEDKNTVDSLLNIRVPGFDLSEISYLKTITAFNADFTPVERVVNSRVQYSEEDVSLIQHFHIVLMPEQFERSFHAVKELQLPVTSPALTYRLEYRNYDYSMGDTNLNLALKYLHNTLSKTPSGPDVIILESLLMSWQMKYREAMEIIDSSEIDLSDNFLALFNRGNFNLAIAGIIASIGTQEIYTIEDNTTLNRYYQAALNDFQRSVRLDPDFIFSRFNLALAFSLTESIESAIEQYTWCIDRYPDLGEAYYNRGLLKIYMQNPTGGCHDLSKSGELGIQSAYQVIYKFCKDE